VYVHLTNNAVQKYSKNYGKFEEGNIVSVDELTSELAAEYEGDTSTDAANKIKKELYD
jgi:hypothetical protein